MSDPMEGYATRGAGSINRDGALRRDKGNEVQRKRPYNKDDIRTGVQLPRRWTAYRNEQYLKYLSDPESFLGYVDPEVSIREHDRRMEVWEETEVLIPRIRGEVHERLRKRRKRALANARLTGKQYAATNLLSQGHTVEQIAERLSLSLSGVRYLLSRAYIRTVQSKLKMSARKTSEWVTCLRCATPTLHINATQECKECGFHTFYWGRGGHEISKAVLSALECGINENGQNKKYLLCKFNELRQQPPVHSPIKGGVRAI